MFARNSGNIRNILQKEFVIFVGLIDNVKTGQ